MTSYESEGSDWTEGAPPVVTAHWALLPQHLGNPSPLPRDSLSCCLANSTVYLFGGFSEHGDNQVYFNEFWTASAAAFADAETPVAPGVDDFPDGATSRWEEASSVSWRQLVVPEPVQPTWGHTAFRPTGMDFIVVIGGHGQMNQPLMAFDLQQCKWARPKVTRVHATASSFDFDDYAATTVGGDGDEAAPSIYLHSQGITDAAYVGGEAGQLVAVVFGGLRSETECSDAVYLYEPSSLGGPSRYDMEITVTELATTGNKPGPRFGHSATCYEGGMFVFGGTIIEDDVVNLNDVLRLDLASGVWRTLRCTSSVPQPDGRMLFTSLLDSGVGMWYMLGGRMYDCESTPFDMLAFDLTNFTWTTINSQSGPYPQTAVSMGAAVVQDDQDDDFVAFLFGGEIDGGYSDQSLLLRITSEERLHFIAKRQRIDADRSESRGGEDVSPTPDPSEGVISSPVDTRSSTAAAAANYTNSYNTTNNNRWAHSLHSSTSSSMPRQRSLRGTSERDFGQSQPASPAGVPAVRPAPVSARNTGDAGPTSSGAAAANLSAAAVSQPTTTAAPHPQPSQQPPLHQPQQSERLQTFAPPPAAPTAGTAPAHQASAADPVLELLRQMRSEMHDRFFEMERRVEETNRRVDQLREWVLRSQR